MNMSPKACRYGKALLVKRSIPCWLVLLGLLGLSWLRCETCGLAAQAMPTQWGAFLATASLAEQTPLPEETPKKETRLEGPRDVLAAFGVTESFLQSLEDGRPVQPAERELLLRVLFYSHMFQPPEIAKWAESPPRWSDVHNELDGLRGKLFRVPGYVKKAMAEDVPPELSSRLGMKSYYLCEVTGDDGISYWVYAKRLPRKWKLDEPIHEKTLVHGIFLKLASEDPESPQPVLVTDRPGWFPDNLLGRLGMDCALFDDVVPTRIDKRFVEASSPATDDTESLLDRLRLTGRDRECFYQLMAAANRTRPGELFRIAKEELARQQRTASSVVPLFNDPAEQQGKLVLLYGTARRIEEVTVENPDIQKRLGISRYYTIYLFTEDSQNYPVVFCVMHLPPGVTPGERPRYAVDLALSGFFYKTWAFRPQRNLSPDAPPHAWQLAPLLIGREALKVTSRAAQNTGVVTFTLLGGVLILIMVVVIAATWFTWREKKRPPFLASSQISAGGEQPAPDFEKMAGPEDRVPNDRE